MCASNYPKDNNTTAIVLDITLRMISKTEVTFTQPFKPQDCI